MSNVTEYLVTLKPLDAYFFSGRETFNYSNGKEIKNKDDNNYYVKSEYFPQQTTILGVMRKEILIACGKYEEDRSKYSENYNEIKDLIGNGSFDAEETEKNKDGFGLIKNISPMFLYKDGNIFTPAPLDYNLDFEKSDGSCHFNSNDKENIDLEHYKKYIPNLKKYKAKDGLNRKIVSFNPFDKIYSFDDVFKKDERIGIDTNKEDKENGYYRQLNYKLQKDFEFCFFIELENIKDENGEEKQIFKNKYSTTIYMGAEGRPFKLEITAEKDINFKKTVENFEITKNRIVCISDVLLDKDEFKELKENSDFLLGETQFFKNFVYYHKYVKTKDKKEAKPYMLLKRGSVIYFSNESQKNKITKLINKSHIKMIGYNYITGGVE